eukprot:545009-Rhodomonas_salina.2
MSYPGTTTAGVPCQTEHRLMHISIRIGHCPSRYASANAYSDTRGLRLPRRMVGSYTARIRKHAHLGLHAVHVSLAPVRIRRPEGPALGPITHPLLPQPIPR